MLQEQYRLATICRHKTGLGAGDVEKSPELTRTAAETLDRIARVSREMQFAEGLNPAQWEALRYIARANTQSRTPGALASFLCTTKGTVSQTLIALECKGYVTRIRSEEDRRKVVLQVTPAGEKLLNNDPLCRIAEATAMLPQRLSESLAEGLEQLLSNLQAQKGAKEFGVCYQCGLFIPGGTCGSGEESLERRCGLTGQVVDEENATKLCVEFRP
jgi:DNA-binding MarR family transcriptional regulator